MGSYIVHNVCTFEYSVNRPYKICFLSSMDSLLAFMSNILYIHLALENEVPMDLTLHQSSLEHPDLSDVEEEGEESGAGEEELRRVEGELADLQNRFDKSMMKKHSLSSMCQELTTKLKLARNLLEG